VRGGEAAARGPDVREGDRLAHPTAGVVRGGVLMATVPGRKGRVKRMTTEQYLSGPPDEFKAELSYGEFVVCPPPADLHQDLLHDLGELLKRWARSEQLGKVSFDIDMVLDELKNLVYAPDLLFLLKEHEARRKKGRVYGPADLCVEIFSPSD